ncbi:MAG: tRNA preQ1(34) S-adenosylmethionine ribosyltransferase-isomerase QueA [Pseudomonadota bacterium]
MQLNDFDFHLPDELIALRPARPRPASRLLIADERGETDSTVARIADTLRAGDLLLLNDTKVIPGRLHGLRKRRGGAGAQIEITLISADPSGAWHALARPAKRLMRGDIIEFEGKLEAVVEDRSGGEVKLSFSRTGPDFDAALDALGNMPLPPYISGRRAADLRDRADYQTVFAKHPGAVAAPTAALHFDNELLAHLERQGILFARVTLHVGAGTFLPVKVDNIEDHRMHAEWGEIGADAVETILQAQGVGGRIIPVGTTALRVIETAGSSGEIVPWRGETDIFIRPGYEFRMTDGLMTNFHLPRSTLIMLVSALMGLDRTKAIYAHAIAQRYRFFSYGDSSLLFPDGAA